MQIYIEAAQLIVLLLITWQLAIIVGVGEDVGEELRRVKLQLSSEQSHGSMTSGTGTSDSPSLDSSIVLVFRRGLVLHQLHFSDELYIEQSIWESSQHYLVHQGKRCDTEQQWLEHKRELQATTLSPDAKPRS